MRVLNTVLSVALWTVGILHFMLIAATVSILLLILPARRVFPVARFACRNQLRFMGCRLEVVYTAEPNPESAYILLGNHESIFDIFAIGAALPGFAIGLEAAPHFDFPIWGRLTRAWGNIPLPEGRITEARTALAAAGDVLQSGTHVVVLPEGHRTRTGRLGPLKKGAFHLALATRGDILPFVLKGLYEFKNTHSWRLHPRTLRVVFGEPILWQDYAGESPNELRDRAREALESLDLDP